MRTYKNYNCAPEKCRRCQVEIAAFPTAYPREGLEKKKSVGKKPKMQFKSPPHVVETMRWSLAATIRNYQCSLSKKLVKEKGEPSVAQSCYLVFYHYLYRHDFKHLPYFPHHLCRFLFFFLFFFMPWNSSIVFLEHLIHFSHPFFFFCCCCFFSALV